MGNSNAFDYNVYTVWAPGFVSLLLYLLDFVYMDLFVVFGEMLPPMCFTLKMVMETHTHTRGMKLQYITVLLSGHHSSFAVAQSLFTPLKEDKKYIKTSTENVNTTKKKGMLSF